MFRAHRLKVAGFVATLFPAVAFSGIETFIIQIGNNDEILDTVVVTARMDKLPEVNHPNGYEWESLERDSSWSSADGYQVSYFHSFAVTMGDRKGYGFNDVRLTNADGAVQGMRFISAVATFKFPGDTTMEISWGPATFLPLSEGVDQLLSGYGTKGNVPEWIGEQLTMGKWARLLQRKKVRPAGESKPIVSHKETFHILRAEKTSDDQNDFTILDTLVLWADYGKPPEIEPPTGKKWGDTEKDSSWDENESWGLVYAHPFMVSLGSRKAAGFDDLSLRVMKEDFSRSEPQYSSRVSFTIPGDTTLHIFFDPSHIIGKVEAYPYDETAFRPFGIYGQVQKKIGKGAFQYADKEWVRLIKRENGWDGYQESPSSAHVGRKPAPGGQGWLLNFSSGYDLQVPPGAKTLSIFDIQGRLRWKSVNLREGAYIALPSSLPQGVLRLYWGSNPS